MTFEKVYGRAWRSLLGYAKVAEMISVSARTGSNDNICTQHRQELQTPA